MNSVSNLAMSSDLVLFFAMMVGTIAFVRLYLLFFPRTNAYVFGYNVHHFYTGALLLMVSVVFNIAGFRGWEFLVISSIASGLVADQLVYLVVSGGGHRAYFSATSFFGMVGIVALLILIGFLASIYS